MLSRLVVLGLICVAAPLMSRCSSSNGAGACATYATNSFTVDSSRDTSETVTGFAVLDAEMARVCH